MLAAGGQAGGQAALNKEQQQGCVMPILHTTLLLRPSLYTPSARPPARLQNWDGSGGSGAALRHYEATGGRYPLAVKLGTITPHGADVYSYAPDENDMVLDPHLARHLSHWGINMMQVGWMWVRWCG